EEASDLLYETICGNIKPTPHFGRPELLIIPSAMDTNRKPMQAIIEKAFEYEQEPDILDITIAGGFPYSDIDIAGVSIVVTSDNNEVRAKEIINELCDLMNDNTDKYLPDIVPVDQAIKMANKSEKTPMVFVES